MSMISVTSLDTVRIEVLGEARAVTATGGQWVDFRQDAMRLRQELHDQIEYMETVDAMLDGFVPTRTDPNDKTSEQLWLKERVALLLQRHEDASDKLSDCWLFLDQLARCPDSDVLRAAARSILIRQQCPGWKDGKP